MSAGQCIKSCSAYLGDERVLGLQLKVDCQLQHTWHGVLGRTEDTACSENQYTGHGECDDRTFSRSSRVLWVF